MRAKDVTPGAILLTHNGGCLTAQATSFLEVRQVDRVGKDGVVHIIGRAVGSVEDNYAPFAIYGYGIELQIRPAFCDLVRAPNLLSAPQGT